MGHENGTWLESCLEPNTYSFIWFFGNKFCFVTEKEAERGWGWWGWVNWLEELLFTLIFSIPWSPFFFFHFAEERISMASSSFFLLLHISTRFFQDKDIVGERRVQLHVCWRNKSYFSSWSSPHSSRIKSLFLSLHIIIIVYIQADTQSCCCCWLGINDKIGVRIKM